MTMMADQAFCLDEAALAIEHMFDMMECPNE